MTKRTILGISTHQQVQWRFHQLQHYKHVQLVHNRPILTICDFLRFSLMSNLSSSSQQILRTLFLLLGLGLGLGFGLDLRSWLLTHSWRSDAINFLFVYCQIADLTLTLSFELSGRQCSAATAVADYYEARIKH